MVLSTLEFLYVDLCITSALAVVIGRTGPTEVLHETRPLAKLFCASNLVPLFCEIILILLVLLASLYTLSWQPWFVNYLKLNFFRVEFFFQVHSCSS